VVVVPFPFVELALVRSRPALVVSTHGLGRGQALIWVLMITNAAHDPWSGDVAVAARGETGLPVPSLVRTSKIATVEAREARRIGRISAPAWRQVLSELAAAMPIS